MSYFDRLNEMAMRRLMEMERDPAYKMLQRHLEDEQRNPALRLAREMTQRQIEEEQRNPGLRILRERLERELNNPVLRIAREHLDQASKMHGLFEISNRSLGQISQYIVKDRLREWERKIPDWILHQRNESASTFRSMITHFGEAQQAAALVASQTHLDLKTLDTLHGLNRFAILGKELSALGGLGTPELDNTFLFATARRLSRIEDVSEMHDAVLLDQEFESFLDHILSNIKALGSKLVSRDIVSAILVSVIVAALQQAQSYKWRLDDKKDANQQAEQQNAKLDAVLRALNELEHKAEQSAVGKLYVIERTTPTFEKPGKKQRRIGYVYSGQSVLAIGSTGRWILIEYTDPIDLESRVGWIRKKYAKRLTLPTNSISQSKLRLLIAISFYESGELSLGQAAETARLSKKAFIDVLGDRQIPILNYSAEELQAEIVE